jgi:hypothetical protein
VLGPRELPEDPIGVAMDMAVERFGDKGDGMFNAAGFGLSLMQVAGLSGGIDGHLVRAILKGRRDVVWRGDAHFQCLRPAAPPSAPAPGVQPAGLKAWLRPWQDCPCGSEEHQAGGHPGPERTPTASQGADDIVRRDRGVNPPSSLAREAVEACAAEHRLAQHRDGLHRPHVDPECSACAASPTRGEAPGMTLTLEQAVEAREAGQHVEVIFAPGDEWQPFYSDEALYRASFLVGRDTRYRLKPQPSPAPGPSGAGRVEALVAEACRDFRDGPWTLERTCKRLIERVAKEAARICSCFECKRAIERELLGGGSSSTGTRDKGVDRG